MDARIARARAHCQERRLNFTPQREAVHRALLAVDGPVKAYDLLTRMQRETPGLAAMTVYRALDFLIDAGLIHKIAATASFVPCAHEGEHTHGQVAFLVCKRCGAVDEVQAEGIVDALDRAKPHRTGFTMQSIEVHGLCADCAGTASSDCAGTAS
ncbi:Fur family transcriptional regulator [Tepidimonas sp.]|uniref:Fur family transcriptional regulator n=1 Tax=Tepidimonas sp. TaxID=2002775 RepID=UPI002FE31B57